MRISDLPQGGKNFKVASGSSSLKSKLAGAARVGDLKGLRANQDSVLKAVRAHESAISQGKFSSSRQNSAFRMVKKSAKNLSAQEEREIRSLFRHLSTVKPEVEKAPKKINIEKALDKEPSPAMEKRAQAREQHKILSRVKNKTADERLGARVSIGEVNAPQDRGPSSDRLEFLREKASKKQKMLKERMPRHRVHYDKEREKRLEVSSFKRDLNKKFNPLEEEKKASEDKKEQTRGYEPFQNL